MRPQKNGSHAEARVLISYPAESPVPRAATARAIEPADDSTAEVERGSAFTVLSPLVPSGLGEFLWAIFGP